MEYTTLVSDLPFNSISWLALTVLLLPFFSFLILLFTQKVWGKTSAGLATTILLINTIIAVIIFFLVWNDKPVHSRIEWFSLPTTQFTSRFTIGIFINRLSAIMLVVVNFVSFLVHLYSIEYMRGDQQYQRYFAFLGLFTFAMLGIVLMDNLLTIFIFWELVGVSSYALIGFWYQDPSTTLAGNKAFIVNRIGDLGFLLGMLILWSQFSTLDLQALKAFTGYSLISEDNLWISYMKFNGTPVTRSMDGFWVMVAGLGLFCGAVGKSAQFPLQIWLPDAMKGPTPVSALIHAATMVAAGVFFLARIFSLLDVTVLTIIAIVGAVTAFMGAIAAVGQHDIKKVLAYSTISQLGYMVMGVGVGAYNAAIFHLITHAMFKACLFLGAGAIIYAMHQLEKNIAYETHFDPQDMRYMGGLRKKMPVTFVCFLIAGMALSGLPLFSGFLSKDAILVGATVWAASFSQGNLSFHILIPALAFITALLTPFYMGRQILLVFFGNFRLATLSELAQKAYNKLSDPPLLMRIPLMILALLSISFFYSLNPLDGGEGWIMEGFKTPKFVVPITHELRNLLVEPLYDWHVITAFLSITLVLMGFLFALFLYNPKSRYTKNYLALEVSSQSILTRISYHNWYLDTIYRSTVVWFVLRLSSILAWIDQKLVDKIVNSTGVTMVIIAKLIGWVDRVVVDGMVNLTAYLAGSIGWLARFSRSGRIQRYFIWSFISLLVFIFWIMLSFSGE